MKKYNLDGEIAEFDFHDEEGFWSFCGPKSLKAFLETLSNGEKAEITINSPGGSVIAGVEMANAIKNSGAHLIAHVTGMAASMASVIACACDEIVLEEASIVMIHDPWAECAGNAEELRKEANVLDQMKTMILGFYRGKFKKCGDAELADLMSKTTYMTANECVEAGLEASVVKSDVRYAAKLTVRDMATAPDAARAFFKTAEMPADVKAAIDAAREAAKAEPPSEDEAHEAAVEEPAAADSAAAAPAAAESPVQSPKGDCHDAEDWEARYKGSSKKINELQAKIADLEGQLASSQSLATELDAAKASINEFKDKLEKADKGLVDANAKISDLTGKLEKSEKALAESRQQLDHLKSTRDLLTGGVLTPSSDGSYNAQMDKAIKSGTVNDRMALRKQKAAGKIK